MARQSRDPLSKQQRSYCMSKVRQKDTDIELLLRSQLHRAGFRFRKHVKSLPGCPDIVFVTKKTVVFVDGDFWHGYRFPLWKETLPEYWQAKIERNRKRDRRNFAKLRRHGWRVIRIWGHELKRDSDAAFMRIASALGPLKAEM